MAFDSQMQKRIMGRFATGVTVVSTVANGKTWGMTANAVTSLSLNPPLVLFCVVRDGQSCEKFHEGGCFAVSILAEQHQGISDRFAFKGPRDFSGLDARTSVTGAPFLADALAWLDCRVVGVFPGGDHDIFVGEIVAGDVGDGTPLLYYGGGYARLGEAGHLDHTHPFPAAAQEPQAEDRPANPHP